MPASRRNRFLFSRAGLRTYRDQDLHPIRSVWSLNDHTPASFDALHELLEHLERQPDRFGLTCGFKAPLKVSQRLGTPWTQIEIQAPNRSHCLVHEVSSVAVCGRRTLPGQPSTEGRRRLRQSVPCQAVRQALAQYWLTPQSTRRPRTTLPGDPTAFFRSDRRTANLLRASKQSSAAPLSAPQSTDLRHRVGRALRGRRLRAAVRAGPLVLAWAAAAPATSSARQLKTQAPPSTCYCL
jgi:hypothetical protein